MFKKFTNASVTLVNRFLPDAFIFALILTIFTFVAGIGVTGQTPLAMVTHWGRGVWSLLAFSMQMVLVLVLGSAMAKAPIIKNLLKTIASKAKTPGQAILITGFVSTVACLLNWGFGLVVGALLAREMARQVKGLDYRLLIATAYSGFLIWHGGISGSIPLLLAGGTPEALGAQTAGAVTAAIPTSMTIFSNFNLTIVVLLLIGIPLVCYAMIPAKENTVIIDPALLIEPSVKEYNPSTPAERLEHSRILWILTLLLSFSFIIWTFATRGFNLDLNLVNLVFLSMGLLFHGDIKRYIDAIEDSARSSAGIIIQFPFYAGIMGMMTGVNAATGGSLAGVISMGFVNISTATTFPLFSFLSAGIVNFFVPSGGGQWAVQAPIMMPAGAALGIAPNITAMTIAWGDSWTNMIQPFWALPALGIAGLSARDIMGYCVITLLLGGVVICGVFLFFPLLGLI